MIDQSQDHVLFIPLCSRYAGLIELLGRPVEDHDAREVVIVSCTDDLCRIL